MSQDDEDAALAHQQLLQNEELAMLTTRLAEIQRSLNAPKGQFNKFGGYRYRSCEDILMAVKPLLEGLALTINDEIVQVADRIYVKATATITDGKDSISATAFAREAADKKGMDSAQVTGSTSSYARKYALNGLLLIDDNKDADSTNTHGQDQQAKPNHKKTITPTDGALDNLDAKQAALAREVAEAIKDAFAGGDEYRGYEEYGSVDDVEVRIGIWELLKSESKIRSTLKRMAEEERATQAEVAA